MYRTLTLIALILLSVHTSLFAGDVANLKTDYSPSRLVIEYDIAGSVPGTPHSIEVLMELNGKSYRSNMLSMSGDFGNAVVAGRGKRIVWNHPLDFPEGLESVFICRVNSVPATRLINEAEAPAEGFRNATYAVNRQTVAESRTGLMWARSGNLFRRPMRFDDARREVEQLNRDRFAGYSDWRVPTRDDVEGLFFFGKKAGWGHTLGRFMGDYLHNSGFTDLQAGNYWTATPETGESPNVYVANTWNGVLRALPASNFYYLLPVRSYK
jgi:hypothetical protein